MENLNLSIANPCSRNWSDFTPTQNGGFCSTCSKVVIDFTTMSDADIQYFFKNKAANTCGRFRPDQLTYVTASLPRINPGMMLLKAGILSLFFLLAKNASAQHIMGKTSIENVRQETAIQRDELDVPDRLIKGTIRSNEDNIPLAGVSIYLKNSDEGTVTDHDGKFEFPRRLKEGDVLVFSFVGYVTQEYTIPREYAGDLQLTLEYDSLVIMGDVAVDEPYDAK